MAEAKGEAKAFKAQLSAESLTVFNEAAQRPFKDQAVFFLDAFWAEYGHLAEGVYMITRNMFQMADMQAKGVNVLFSYDEGIDLDFDMGLYVFEQHQFFRNNPTDLRFKQFGLPGWVVKERKWNIDYDNLFPAEMTAIARKKELRDTVDVNFDGRVSLLEYLLYVLGADPVELINRSVNQSEEHPEIKEARAALAEVQRAVKAYESKKAQLTEAANSNGGRGVASLRARNQLAQLNSSPEWDALNKALITAEAKVRIACRKYGGNANLAASADGSAPQPMRNEGTLWWMQRELQEAKERYGPRGTRR